MPTVSESTWRFNKERQDVIVDDFLAGRDTQSVFRARLFALGLRGYYLDSEVRQAVGRKGMLDSLPKVTAMVVVKEVGRQVEYLRFIDSDSANQAITLLRKQPHISWAVRATDIPMRHDDIRGLPYIVESAAIMSS